MRDFLRKKSLVFALAVVQTLVIFFSSTFAYAADFSSSNYILREPAFGQSGGTSTSSNYKGDPVSGGQFTIGEITSSNYKLDTAWVYTVAEIITTTTTNDGGGVVVSGGSSSSGGGGSGGASSSPTSTTPTVDKKAGVKFLGKTFPGAKVALLKDGKSQGEFTADAKGDFAISLTDLTSGNFNFVLYTQDLKGTKSKNFSRDVDAIKGKTLLVENIIFEPTIYLNKNEVRRGDGVTISGQAVYDDFVTAVIGGDIVSIDLKITEDGSYFYNFDTTSLDLGKYDVYVMTKDGLKSSVVNFIVGEKNILAVPVEDLRGDISDGGGGDGVVNLVDFSILAFWYGKKLPEDMKKIVDLTGDGVVDLKDFSILASNWTG